MAALEDALRFGGLVLAHTAWILSEMEANELLCPIAVIVRDNQREVLAFEAPTQAEAIEDGKTSFEQFKHKVQFWSFAREGLWSIPEGPKEDVITVSSWAIGLDEPVLLQQFFSRPYPNQFYLHGDIRIVIHGLVVSNPLSSRLFDMYVSEGVAQHSHGHLWRDWFTS